MSFETPPGSPSSGPDVPPPPASGEVAMLRLPWEDRARLGLLDALIETVKLLVTAPREAFSRLRQDGDLLWPLLFGLLFSWFGQVFSQMWKVLFEDALQSMMGNFGDLGDLGEFFEPTESGILWAVLAIVVWPIFFAFILLINTFISHLCLMMVGATNESPTGVEGTFKVLCYAQISNLAAVIPLAGGLAALIVSVVLWVIGFAEVHKTTQVKALITVLISMILCCLCCIMIVGSVGVMGGFVAALADA